MKEEYVAPVLEVKMIDLSKWSLENEGTNGSCAGSWDSSDKVVCD